MYDVLAIGETMLLVSPVAGGRLTLDASFAVAPGGAESNVAIQAHRLGASTAWMSRVGDDAIGDLVTEGTAAHGVDTSLVERVAGFPTAVYFKNPRGASTEVIYYRSGSAASTMSSEMLARYRGSVPRLVHVSGITLALSSSCSDMMDAVVLRRHFGEAVVAFDVNYRAGLWDSRQDAASRLAQIARAADVVFVGRDEAEALWGTTTVEDVRGLLPEPTYLVVKDGAVEAVEFYGSNIVRAPAQRVDVVEPVGAGDAFAAGWECAFLAGLGSAQRLTVGHASAASVLASTTDQADDLTQVQALLPSAGV